MARICMISNSYSLLKAYEFGTFGFACPNFDELDPMSEGYYGSIMQVSQFCSVV